MAMLRHARRSDLAGLVRLLVSVRGPEDLYYAAELPGPETTVVHTRRSPEGGGRRPHRLDADDLHPLVVDLRADATDSADSADGSGAAATTAYVCGSAGFADAASQLLVELGVPAARVRVERFGPSG
jgi:ferredoxin-NADP reductase